MQSNSFLKDADFLASAPCATLQTLGLGFIDVGVRGGIHPIVTPVARLTTALAFEPDRVECERLRCLYANSSSWKEVTIEPVALHDRIGTTNLHLTAAATNSSLRPINRAFIDRYQMAKFQPIGTESVTTTTLDSILATRYSDRTQFGEFIKLDTQGTEYEILTGATKTLSDRTVALLVEVWYCEVYDGQKLFSDIEILLRSFGFSCYGSSVHYRSKQFLDKRRHATKERPLWADAVFLKDPLPGGPSSIKLTERQVHVLFVSSMLLGFYDLALELARATWADGKERVRIDRFVHRTSRVSPWHVAFSVLKLAASVLARPPRVNITVGKFIDTRREVCNYEEV